MVSSPLQSAGALRARADRPRPSSPPPRSAQPGAVHPVAELRALPVGADRRVRVGHADPGQRRLDHRPRLRRARSDNETTVVPSTPADAGLQAATAPAQNQLSATLHAHAGRHPPAAAVRRGAGVWTDLLAPADSEVGGLDDLLGDPDLERHLQLGACGSAGTPTSSATTRSTRAGCWSTPTRRTPSSPGTRRPRRGCSRTTRRTRAAPASGPRSVHVLDFAGRAARRPGAGGAALHREHEHAAVAARRARPSWRGAAGPPAGVHVARVLMSSATDLAIGVVTFDEPAFTVDLSVFWTPAHVRRARQRAGGRGRARARGRRPPGVPALAAAVRPSRSTARTPAGSHRVTLRYLRQANGRGHDPAVGGGAGDPQPALPHRPRGARPDRRPGPVPGPRAGRRRRQARLAAQPRLRARPDGADDGRLPGQRAGGRGRAAGRLPHPRPAGPERGRVRRARARAIRRVGLSRRRPVSCTAASRWCSRSTSGSARCCPSTGRRRPSDPAERTQLLEWVLAVEQADGTRLSVPTADWVVEHRGTAPPPAAVVPWVIDDVLVRAGVRRAPTLQPFAQRLEALELLSPSCGLSDVRLHSSQMLTPRARRPGRERPDGGALAGPHHAAGCRSPQGGPARLAAPVRGRRRDRPDRCRRGPDQLDRLAGRRRRCSRCRASRHRDCATTPCWATRTGTTSRSAAEVDPAGGAAGVAVAVSGLPRVERALLALVDAASGQLRLQARRGGTTQDLESTPLPGWIGCAVRAGGARLRRPRAGADRRHLGRGRSRRPAGRSGRGGHSTGPVGARRCTSTRWRPTSPS